MERNDETLEILEISMYSFQMMADEIKVLMHNAIGIEYDELAIHTNRALDGLNGIVSFIAETRSAILKEKGTVIIPVTNGNKPTLKIVGGTDYAKRNNS